MQSQRSASGHLRVALYSMYTTKRKAGLLMCRCRFSLPFRLRELLARLVFAFRLTMTAGSQLQVRQRKQGKDKGLHHGDEDFKWDEDNVRQERQDEREDRQHHAAREDVAEKTEGQRDDARDLTDDLQQADEELDETSQAELEQRAEVQVLADVFAEAQRSEAKDLGGNHGDQRHCQVQIQIGRRRAHPGNQRVRDGAKEQEACDRRVVRMLGGIDLLNCRTIN